MFGGRWLKVNRTLLISESVSSHLFLPKATAKGSLEKSVVIKESLYRLSPKTAPSSAEVMAVIKDCHQRLPKVLLKRWLSSKIVIKDCQKFC